MALKKQSNNLIFICILTFLAAAIIFLLSWPVCMSVVQTETFQEMIPYIGRYPDKKNVVSCIDTKGMNVTIKVDGKTCELDGYLDPSMKYIIKSDNVKTGQFIAKCTNIKMDDVFVEIEIGADGEILNASELYELNIKHITRVKSFGMACPNRKQVCDYSKEYGIVNCNDFVATDPDLTNFKLVVVEYKPGVTEESMVFRIEPKKGTIAAMQGNKVTIYGLTPSGKVDESKVASPTHLSNLNLYFGLTASTSQTNACVNLAKPIAGKVSGQYVKPASTNTQAIAFELQRYATHQQYIINRGSTIQLEYGQFAGETQDMHFVIRTKNRVQNLTFGEILKLTMYKRLGVDLTMKDCLSINGNIHYSVMRPHYFCPVQKVSFSTIPISER
jgi:hypothetical protein